MPDALRGCSVARRRRVHQQVIDDHADFHAALQGACEAYRPGSYAQFKAWCDRYFYLPHRQEPRGVGGIFFDDLSGGDRDADFAFVRSVGEAFLRVYPQIVARRKDTPYDEAAREQLLVKRGRYVEFNLVYDRGTRFGFRSGRSGAIQIATIEDKLIRSR